MLSVAATPPGEPGPPDATQVSHDASSGIIDARAASSIMD
jgi:hypothetical protein